VSIYLNPANPVRDIDMPQLKELFAGRIANWREIGGADAEVHVLRRPPNSGTHQLFRELVLDEEPYAERATILPTTAAVIDAVRHDAAAVGYGALSVPAHRPPTPGLAPAVRGLRVQRRRSAHRGRGGLRVAVGGGPPHE
jgi:hypothetical protein